MAQRNKMALELSSHAENVGVARVAVGAFAATLEGLTLAELDEIKVAVSEAVTNAVLHGYRHGTGVVRIEGEIDGDVLGITVTDYGVGIADVELARQPSYSTDPERMGLGFVFMESFMDEVAVTSELGRGTTVRMVKRRGGPERR